MKDSVTAKTKVRVTDENYKTLAKWNGNVRLCDGNDPQVFEIQLFATEDGDYRNLDITFTRKAIERLLRENPIENV